MKEQIQQYLEAIKASYGAFGEMTSVRQEMVKRFNENVAVTVGNKYLKAVSYTHLTLPTILLV